ncbi:pitrilysin family protein [Candidatus Methylospira mobilis]|uniref:M16 family metallopeptidase n=1 Tax=Candidatus Methylospira mobilis TaxID=1808979 RepID=UPI0028E1EDD2|nr:pitrilysin family protein [Candidatus Methylospira mobilis]WNV03644.1 pitrilysin family protein [Candidatus Methylospira mobilis]
MYVKTMMRGLIFLMLCWASVVEATPKIQTWVLQNGARAYFVPTEGLPMLDVRVVFDAGSARDEARYGQAMMTSGLLDTGAGSWDADAIAQRLEGVGAHLGSGVTRDSAWVSLRTLTQEKLLATALDTAREVLTHPLFNQKDFDRERNNLLVALRQRDESPADLAALALFSALYGDHPYAHPKEGNPDTVEKLTRDDLLAFYQRYYTARNAIIVLVGDVSRQQAETVAGNLLGGLPSGEAAPPLPPVNAPAAANIVKKPFPSQQTHVLSGLPVLRVGDPDYFPLYVGNHILGGSGMVSRIFEEVREKRGLAYSASSYLYPFRVEGPFLMSLQTRNDQTDAALGVMMQTVREFIEKGPSEQELQDSRKNITGGFPLRIDSNQKLIEQVAAIAYYGLPLDYLDTFIGKVEAVTVADIKKAFKARIKPDALQTVLVGPGTEKPHEK